MKCEELAERVTGLLEGALPANKILSVRIHLWLCVSCRRYVDQVRRTMRFLADGPPPPPPAPDVEDRIVGSLLSRPPGA